MRVVIDTNVFVSALLVESSPAARLLEHWRRGRLSVMTAAEQLEEIIRVLRYPKLRDRIPARLGNDLVAELHELAVFVEDLPWVERSIDAADNYLLALAEASEADYLISGDKRHILVLGTHVETQIVSLRKFMDMIEA